MGANRALIRWWWCLYKHEVTGRAGRGGGGGGAVDWSQHDNKLPQNGFVICCCWSDLTFISFPLCIAARTSLCMSWWWREWQTTRNVQDCRIGRMGEKNGVGSRTRIWWLFLMMMMKRGTLLMKSHRTRIWNVNQGLLRKSHQFEGFKYVYACNVCVKEWQRNGNIKMLSSGRTGRKREPIRRLLRHRVKCENGKELLQIANLNW